MENGKVSEKELFFLLDSYSESISNRIANKKKGELLNAEELVDFVSITGMDYLTDSPMYLVSKEVTRKGIDRIGAEFFTAVIERGKESLDKIKDCKMKEMILEVNLLSIEQGFLDLGILCILDEKNSAYARSLVGQMIRSMIK